VNRAIPSAEVSDEIVLLVERLRATEVRLEELTAGEIDAVATREGEVFLLRAAQEQLRENDSTKQAAILDAIPANVALLDLRGIIVAVNQAWRQFASANDLGDQNHGLGSSYLTVCDRAVGDGSEEGRLTAEGIRQVLEGAQPNYSLGYACHSGTEQRWFQLTVTALSGRRHGAVVMHANVTAQKAADDALRASDLRFRQMAQNIEDVFFLIELGSGQMLYVSPAYERIWGRGSAQLYGDPRAWFDAIHPDDKRAVSALLSSGSLPKAFEIEFRIERPDGAIRVVESRGFPVHDTNGRTIRLAVIAKDVTERNRLEQSVFQSEQHFHFLDDIAQATRALDEPGRIMAVMTRMLGQHLSASRCAYAIVDRDAGHFTTLVNYTDNCISTVGTHEAGIFGRRAVQTLESAQTLVIRDVPAEVPAGEGAEAFAAIGILATITCPLVKQGRLRALMAVHQTTPRDWTAAEIAVVEEVVERCWTAVERRKAEERLRENEALLRIAGRTAQLGGWAVEAADKRVTWSDEVCNALEVPPGTIPPYDAALSFCLPASNRSLANAIDLSLRDGDAFDLELEMTTARGRAIWVRCTGEAQRNHVGTIVRTHGAFQDITDRKRTVEVLKTTVEEFRTLSEAVPQIVWITLPDGCAIYFNQHWTNYTGVALAASLGNEWTASLHPDDRERAIERARGATRRVEGYSIEYRLRAADGSYRWWLARGVPQCDAAGQILKWFGTCTDVNDLKMAELAILDANRALAESERRFSDMLANVQLASIMLDCAGLITYCNDYFLGITGWKRDEVMGRDWFTLFLPPDQQHLRDVFVQTLSAPPPSWYRENEIVTRSGERRLIRWNISMLRSSSGEVIGTASVGEDITDRTRAETSVKHLNRVYSVLSGINTLIVRVGSREELFREACRIAVEAGGFRMSMICVVDPATQVMEPVASAGKDASLVEAVRVLLASPQGAGNMRIAQALIERRPVISNDWQHDTGPVLHDQYVAAGVRSLAAIPLIVAGQAIGVFALYANEINFFHDEEMKLLLELADDIAFAIDHIGKGERITYLAYYDSLTGLANRVLFHERLTQAARHARLGQGHLALVLLDIERFQTLNDTFGRETGDRLLIELSARLTEHAKSESAVARIDADHFAIIVTDVVAGADLARRIEQWALKIFGPPFRNGEADVRMSAKFGVAIYPSDGADADALFRNAEAALKNAKAGLERCQFYANSMNAHVAEKLALEHQLRLAIERQEFVLHYQPKTDLANGALTGCEALLRWNDPTAGLVAPGRFIPILEETGLIFEVGRWALRQALADRQRWRSLCPAGMRIAVNVSPLQLRNRDFVAELQHLIGEEGHAAAGLELEITEGMIMHDIDNSIATLKEIRAKGITIAVDDFGTGFSSLSYLAKLPVDTLKIDRSFVNEMTTGPVGLALVSTIITLAHSVKLKVVAEGVETEEQARLLRLLKCDEMQGFLHSRAVSADEFEKQFLTTKRI
jgi:diguanylate cyclase (GGDEF)-like protein/PAS domain S-box-containing protein